MTTTKRNVGTYAVAIEPMSTLAARI